MLQYKQIFIKASTFLTGTPDAPELPELTDISIYQLNLPIIELAKVNIMGFDLFIFWILNSEKLLFILVVLRHYALPFHT
jgi:hypothetical protein